MLLRNYFFGKNSKMGGPTQFKISLSEEKNTFSGEKKLENIMQWMPL